MRRPTPPLAVLIVEDEALLAMDMETMVEDSGHRVIGEAASLHDVELLPIDPSPDLALVDVHLARGSSGLDVCRLIQARWERAFIVFVTANPAKLDDGECGHHGVIPKPFSRTGLMAAMRYIEEGVCDPPPASSEPTSFHASPAFIDSWSR